MATGEKISNTGSRIDWARVRDGVGSCTNPEAAYTNSTLKQLASILGLSQMGNKSDLLKRLEPYRPTETDNISSMPKTARRSMFENLPFDVTIKILQDLIEEGDHQTYISLCQTSSHFRKMCDRLENEIPSFWYHLLEQTDDVGAMSKYLKNAVFWDKSITDKTGKKNPNYGKIIDKDEDGNETKNKDYVGKSLYQLWKMFVVDREYDISWNSLINFAENGKLSSIVYALDINDSVVEDTDLILLMMKKATSNGHSGIVRYLVENSQVADTFTVDQMYSVIKTAVIMDDIGLVEYLLSKNYPTTFGAFIGNTIIQTSVISSNVDMLNFIRQHDSQEVEFQTTKNKYLFISPNTDMYKMLYNTMNLNNMIPSNDVIDKKRVDMIKYLVENAADVAAPFSRSYDGNVLYIASLYGVMGAVEYLIDVGKDIYTDEDYSRAVTYAIKGGFYRIVKLLGGNVDNNQKNEMLIEAACYGNLDDVESLIEDGADINYKQGYPLTISVNNGQLPVVIYLISKGADTYIPPVHDNILNIALTKQQNIRGEDWMDSTVEYLRTIKME